NQQFGEPTVRRTNSSANQQFGEPTVRRTNSSANQQFGEPTVRRTNSSANQQFGELTVRRTLDCKTPETRTCSQENFATFADATNAAGLSQWHLHKSWMRFRPGGTSDISRWWNHRNKLRRPSSPGRGDGASLVYRPFRAGRLCGCGPGGSTTG